MELRPGYKLTEAGAIPNDWEYVRLTSFAKLESGHTPSRRKDTYWNGEIPWISLHDTDALTGREIFATAQTVSREGIENSSARLLPKGTVVFSRTATVGKATVMGREMATSQDFANYICGPRVHNHYLVYLFRYMAPAWKKLMAGSIHNTVYMPVFEQLQVVLPSRVEQEAIAQVLCDADGLIESVAQLLVKKREIKKGAMQELLTGKKRLPGFGSATYRASEIGQIPEDWRVTELRKIANVKTGPFGSSLHERDYVDAGTPIITVEHLGERGVVHENLPLVSDLDRKRLSAYSLQVGDIVFSRVGSVDRNARISILERGWLFSGRLMRLRTLDATADTAFLSYQFHSEPFKQRVRTVAVGQTMASLNTQILNAVLVALPTAREQSAIAEILSSMDAEIAALEERLAKARQIKQGMMQELLTGRIRLK
jgi:type I restriction enzyme, S subunit